MKDIKDFLSSDKIKNRIKEIAAQINADYAGEELTVVGVLNGSFIFTADLVRQLNVPVNIEFMSASSYGEGTTSSGVVKINLDLKTNIEGKNVLLVEDIVDTGLTITNLIDVLKTRKPKSLKLCSLLYKPARIKHKVKIDYLAFEIPDNFVVGYGLDFAGKYRELPFIGIYQGPI
jgi:hypoxanthine phosphoribosyltransferase